MTPPTSLLSPRNATEIVDALHGGFPLRVIGGGTKQPLWCDAEPRRLLDMSSISGVTSYQPEELVLGVRAGTSLQEIEALLFARGQRLAFEPPDFSGLFGTGPRRTTIGGVIASGFAGPRRLSAGNVRDHLLGFEAVSGRGERFKAGGRVIKNVTGYDLPKLLAGSWGTLAVMTDLSLRVLPCPEHELTLAIEALGDVEAIRLMSQALNAPLEVSAAAHAQGAAAQTWIRLEGFRRSVQERLQQLERLVGARARTALLEGEASAALWRGLRDLDAYARDDRPLWRLSLPAAASAQAVALISRSVANQVIYDWGGSLVWMALHEAHEDAAQAAVREAVAGFGGHAWLMRAPEAQRGRVPRAPPQPAAIEALSRRIKQGFDPQNRLGGAPLLSEPPPES